MFEIQRKNWWGGRRASPTFFRSARFAVFHVRRPLKRTIVLTALLVCVCATTGPGSPHLLAQEQRSASDTGIRISVEKTKAVVTTGGDLFAEYDFASYSKPILYPLMAPGQVNITRNWPMRDDVVGEAHDHPHHKSLWFAHGDVNGLDFWSEKARIENDSVERIDDVNAADWAGIVAHNRWMGKDGPVCREVGTLRFKATADQRFVDCDYVLTGDRDVTFGDTKEGTFALRTNPALNLTKSSDEAPPAGHAENSEGLHDKELWGQRAKWVSYFGKIDEQDFGIAIFDHPSNLRHPTTWHARDYGLVAANPFGLHEFQGEPAGSGRFVLKPGEKLHLRYQLVIFRGKFDRAQVEAWFDEFAR